jgi:hypothetical protein
MLRSGQRSVRRVVVPGLLGVILSLGIVAPVMGHGGGSSPTYRAVVAPAAVAAGTDGTSTITLTQLVKDHDHGKELGSVRISPPAGFVLTSVSAVGGSTALPVSVASGSATVEYIDLDHPGQTAVVTLTARIKCGIAGDGAWTVVAHQTDKYNITNAKVLTQDPSSQLVSHVSACRLAFVVGRGPSDAGVDKTITSSPADPAGPRIQVRLLDGNGDPAHRAGVGVSVAIKPGTGTAGASIGGVTSSTTSPAGLARFAPTINRSGHDYQLLATAGPAIDSVTSGTFDVDDVAKVCSGPCSGTAQLGDTTATVSAKSDGGVLSMSLGLDDIDCNNKRNKYYVSTSEVVSWDVTSALGRTTVTIKLAAASVDKPVSKYEVCFSSANSTFVNKYGKTIAAGDAGILPWCVNCDKPSGGPCVVRKWSDHAGNVFVRFSVPSGDPRGKI